RRRADADARLQLLRADALLFSGYLVCAARQADLDELALLVRLGFLVPRDALGEIDADLRALDRLPFVVLHRALHHAGALPRRGKRDDERRHAGEHDEPRMTAVQSADHESPPRNDCNLRVSSSLYLSAGSCQLSHHFAES